MGFRRTLHVIFITRLKVLLLFFDNKSGASKNKNKKTYNPAHKMVEKSGKTGILLIYINRLGHIIDWWSRSTLIHICTELSA